MDQVSRALLMVGGTSARQVVFGNGTSNWTVPAGVTTLISVSGKGMDGASDSSTPSGIDFTSDVGIAPGENGNGGFFNFGTAYAEAQSYYNTYISSATLGTLIPYRRWVRYIGTLNSQIVTAYGNPQVAYNYTVKFHSVIDTSPTPAGANNTPTSGELTDYNTQFNGLSYRGFRIRFNHLPFGYAGLNSTAFGLTFPGGSYSAPNGFPANLTTFNNVTVTPGQTYSIVNYSATPVTVVY